LPGGLLYLSYNALPGWSAELPLRKCMVELAATDAARRLRRPNARPRRSQALSRAGLRYFSVNPSGEVGGRGLYPGRGHYLAHEFMNAAWEPFYGVDVGDDFRAIGLRLAGSATLANNHLALMLDAASAEAIATLTSPRQQQLGVEFAVNQRFRRDVFVRGDAMPGVPTPRRDGHRLHDRRRRHRSDGPGPAW
jgi:hypothetical protein